MKDISIMIGDVKLNYRVGLIIEKGEEILVEFNPQFNFTAIPGGRVKTLETTHDALIREMKEEMGIDFTNYQIKLKSFIQNFFEMEDKKFHELFVLYKVTIDENDKNFTENMKNLDSEANYYKWINKNKLKEVNLVPTILRDTIYNEEFESLVLNDLQK